MCEMKAFLIFQSVARGLEAGFSPITGVYWRTGATLTLPAWPCADDTLAPCNTLGIPDKQAYVKPITVHEPLPVLAGRSK